MGILEGWENFYDNLPEKSIWLILLKVVTQLVRGGKERKTKNVDNLSFIEYYSVNRLIHHITQISQFDFNS